MKTREELYKEWLRERTIKDTEVKQTIAWTEKEMKLKLHEEFIKFLKK